MFSELACSMILSELACSMMVLIKQSNLSDKPKSLFLKVGTWMEQLSAPIMACEGRTGAALVRAVKAAKKEEKENLMMLLRGLLDCSGKTLIG